MEDRLSPHEVRQLRQINAALHGELPLDKNTRLQDVTTYLQKEDALQKLQNTQTARDKVQRWALEQQLHSLSQTPTRTKIAAGILTTAATIATIFEAREATNSFLALPQHVRDLATATITFDPSLIDLKQLPNPKAVFTRFLEAHNQGVLSANTHFQNEWTHMVDSGRNALIGTFGTIASMYAIPFAKKVRYGLGKATEVINKTLPR